MHGGNSTSAVVKTNGVADLLPEAGLETAAGTRTGSASPTRRQPPAPAQLRQHRPRSCRGRVPDRIRQRVPTDPSRFRCRPTVRDPKACSPVPLSITARVGGRGVLCSTAVGAAACFPAARRMGGGTSCLFHHPCEPGPPPLPLLTVTTDAAPLPLSWGVIGVPKTLLTNVRLRRFRLARPAPLVRATGSGLFGRGGGEDRHGPGTSRAEYEPPWSCRCEATAAEGQRRCVNA